MNRPASHYFSNQAEEPRVTRVWAAVDARLERRRVRQRWFRPVALACAGAGVIALAWHANDPQRSSGPTVLEIADGSRVEHPRDARVEVMAVAPDRVELRLTRGRAQFSVQPNRQRSFLTHAGEYTVRVVGTVFSVELEPSGLQVGVTRGEVEVRRDGTNDVWRVRTGEHWTSNRLATAAAMPQRAQATGGTANAPHDHDHDHDHDRPAPASDQPGEPAHATATPSAADATSPPAPAQRTTKPRSRAATVAHRSDHPQALPARTRAARPVAASSSSVGPAARTNASAASREPASPDADSRRPAPSPGAIAVPRDLSPSAAGSLPPPTTTTTTMTAATEPPVRDAATSSSAAHPRTQTADEPAALFQRAQQAREAAQPEEAEHLLVRFLQLAPHDPRAGLAAFQLGRTRLELGDPRGALEALDAASHAGTAFTEQIQARRIQALEQLGQTAACRQARAAYLREFPDGAFGGIVRQRCQ